MEIKEREMNKVSIARRREECSGPQDYTRAEWRARWRQLSLPVGGATAVVEAEAPPAAIYTPGGDTALSFELNEKQARVLDYAVDTPRVLDPPLQATFERSKRYFTINFHLEAPTTKRLLTTRQVAEMLVVGRGTVYHLIKRGKLKAYRIGSGYRFEFKDVLEYLAECAIDQTDKYREV